MLKAIILDVDGTLIDSNEAHAKAFQVALQEVGTEVPYDHIRPLIGKGGDQLIPEASGWAPHSEKAQKVADIKKQVFQNEFLPQLQPFPGVLALLKKMREDGLDLVVATAASLADLSLLLNQAQIRDFITDCTSRDDVEESKPAPDVIISALEKLKLSPKETLFVGDTPYDLEAAQSAQVEMIAFECGGWSREHFNEALAVYKDADDLLNHYEDSPIGQRLKASPKQL